ncbi:putative spore germination protein GerPC [Geobacillus sp. BCO2]|nr:putative spore germination protein GerPC [Geobacillus sp. BCO2]
MSIYEYFVQLHRYLLWQTKKIRALERRLRSLEARLREMEAQPRTSIERIEYKFDQLKVETLEGTLNIGIAPPGAGGAIEDFAVEPVKTVIPKPEPVLMRPIQEKVAAYLNGEASETLKRLEQQYGRRLMIRTGSLFCKISPARQMNASTFICKRKQIKATFPRAIAMKRWKTRSSKR